MKITLHNESIDIEVGQKVTFYTYKINDNNELEVTTDETFVDLIDEKNNIVVFKNGDHSSTLHFYQNDRLGERFFLNDTKKNRLRYLKSRIKYYKFQEQIYDNSIEETYDLLSRYISRRKEVNNKLESVNKLIEQLGDGKDE